MPKVATCVLFAFAFAACKHADPARAARVLVSNEDSNDVTILDPTTNKVIETVFVGKRPRGIRISKDGAFAYVALSGSPKAPPKSKPGGKPSKPGKPDDDDDDDEKVARDDGADGIGVVDLATNKLVRTLKSGQDPEAFDLVGDDTLVVSNEETAQASFVAIKSGAVVATVAVGVEPEGVATRPDGAVVYVTSEREDRVTAIDTKTRAIVGDFKTTGRPRGVLFTPDSKRAFVSNELGGTVSIVDAVKHVVIGDIHFERGSGPTPPRPMGLALSPDGARLFVTHGRAGSMAFVDVASGKVERTLTGLGERPWGVQATADGKKLFVAGGPSNDVAIVDVATATVVTHIQAGKSPWGIAITR